jgi:hypothetical protein
MCVLGTRYVDAGLVQVAGSYVDLWRIRDYASDALVLKLCLFYTTVCKIMEYHLHVQPDTTEINQAALHMHSYSTEHSRMPLIGRVHCLPVVAFG